MANSSSRARKVSWPRDNEARFILLLHEKYTQARLLCTSFTATTFASIRDRLNATNLDGSVYSVPQLQTKYKNIKKAWRVLTDLRYKSGSGMAWDSTRNTVIAPPDVLEAIYARNRDHRYIIQHGIPYYDFCTQMFERSTATGQYARSGATQETASEGDPDDDDNADTADGDDDVGTETEGAQTEEMPQTEPAVQRDVTSQNEEGLGNSRVPKRARATTSSHRDAVIIDSLESMTEYVEERRRRHEVSADEVDVCMEYVRAVPNVTMNQKLDALDALRARTTRRMFSNMTPYALAVLPEYIKPWDYTFIPPRILNSHRNYPYFEGAVGALDGTLIPTHVPLNRQAAFRSRKGGVAQNVAAICDFDMNFNYVVAGWEGSASDAHILQTAIERDPSFPWPPDGRYYLVDAGYSNYSTFLAPYRNTRYHLPEFQGTVAAQTPEELFNHRHASLRNCIERAFGLLKSRFALLRYGMPCFRFDNQVNLTLACCVVHNFVNQSRLADPLRQGTYPHYEADDLVFSASEFPTPARIRDQSDFRDEIAAALWENR